MIPTNASAQRALSEIDALLDLDSSARETMLASIASEDAQAAELLRAWLEADQPTDSRFARARFADLLEETEGDTLMPGDRIGAWRVVREIGRGGMGSVWLVERANAEFDQKAALKLVKRGMDSDAVLTRFAVERRILARLEHPNIARLLDGGLHADGRPWFAMEYVDGQGLHEYAERQALSLRQRLRLFVKLCAAVAYAHSRLVVHRDLKPANILVDQKGEPKLLDFGIARVLEGDGERTETTASAVRFLTRAYASPEQSAGLPAGTASDVYALGVVLIELVTGLSAASSDSSHKVDVSEKLSQARRRAGVDGPVSIRPQQLQGDLELIALRALADDPSRRYATVDALSEDILRLLDGRPIQARADSAWYRLQRFVGRHRIGSALGLMAVLALLAATGLSLFQAKLAREQAMRAEATKQFLISIFSSNDPDRAQGRDISARELLDRGAATIATDMKSTPELQQELQTTLVNLYLKLGAYDQASSLALQLLANAQIPGRDVRARWTARAKFAEVQLAQSDFSAGLESIARALEEANSDSSANELELLELRALRASLLAKAGRFDEAVEAYQAVLKSRRQLLGNGAEETLRTMESLAVVFDEQESGEEAAKLLREVLAERRARLGNEHLQTAMAMHNLASTLRDSDNPQEALSLEFNVIEIRRRLLPPESVDIAQALQQYAQILQDMSRYAEGDQAFAEAARILDANPGLEPDLRATVYNNWGTLKYFTGDLIGAEQKIASAAAQWLSLNGPSHRDLLLAQNNLAAIQRDLGHLETAVTTLKAALSELERQQGAASAGLAGTLNLLSETLAWQGKSEECLPYAERSVANNLASAQRPNALVARALLALAECQRYGNRFEAAHASNEDALVQLRTLYPEGSRHTANALQQRALIELDMGHADVAVKFAREALAVRERQKPIDELRLAIARAVLAESNMVANSIATADPAIASAVAALRAAGRFAPEMQRWQRYLGPGRNQKARQTQ